PVGAHFCLHFRNSSHLCRRPEGNGAPHAGRAIHTPVLAPALPSAYRVDLLVGRKPAGLLLRKGEPAIDGNLKHPADPGHQLDIGAVFLFQPIPRTEGARFIVSRLAPLDSDFHRFVLSSAMMVQFYHAASAASRRAAGTRDGIVEPPLTIPRANIGMHARASVLQARLSWERFLPSWPLIIGFFG